LNNLRGETEESFCVDEERPAFVGERDLLFVAIKKTDAELILEIFDLARERRLRGVQFRGRLRKAKRLSHADEITKVSKFHR
jgi:hypothetical protein